MSNAIRSIWSVIRRRGVRSARRDHFEHRAARSRPRRRPASLLAVLALVMGVVLPLALSASAPTASAADPLPPTSTEAPLPANAAAIATPQLVTVSCPAEGSCVAVGNYTDTNGNGDGLIETEADGTWTSMEAPVPANLTASSSIGARSAELTGLSCWAAESCVAIGT